MAEPSGPADVSSAERLRDSSERSLQKQRQEETKKELGLGSGLGSWPFSPRVFPFFLGSPTKIDSKKVGSNLFPFFFGGGGY